MHIKIAGENRFKKQTNKKQCSDPAPEVGPSAFQRQDCNLSQVTLMRNEAERTPVLEGGAVKGMSTSPLRSVDCPIEHTQPKGNQVAVTQPT